MTHLPPRPSLTIDLTSPLTGDQRPEVLLERVRTALSAAGIQAQVRLAPEQPIQRLMARVHALDLPDDALRTTVLNLRNWPSEARTAPAGVDAQLAELLAAGWDEAAIQAELKRVFLAQGAGLPRVSATLSSEDDEFSATVDATPWLAGFSPEGLEALLADQGGASSHSTDPLFFTFVQINEEVQGIDAYTTARMNAGAEEGYGTDAELDPGELLDFVRARAAQNSDYARLAAKFVSLDPDTVDHRDLQRAAQGN